MRTSTSGGDDEDVKAFEPVLFRLSDRMVGGGVAFTKAGRGPKMPISKLQSGDAFILDTGFEIFVRPHTRTRARTHTHMQICMHVHVHAHARVYMNVRLRDLRALARAATLCYRSCKRVASRDARACLPPQRLTSLACYRATVLPSCCAPSPTSRDLPAPDLDRPRRVAEREGFRFPVRAEVSQGLQAAASVANHAICGR